MAIINKSSSPRPQRSAGFEPVAPATTEEEVETPSVMELCHEDENDDHPQQHLEISTSQCLSKVPRLWRYDHKPPEATALALDISARAMILMSSIFLGPALLELATAAAEENCVAPREEACRIYGFLPSSLLSNIAVVAGFLGSAAMPVFGATVDHTSYRWQMGAGSAMGLVLVKGVEVMVSAQTWFLVACLQVVSIVLFHMHVTTTYAYTSELSTDAAEQTAYNTYYVVVLYLFSLLFLAFVTTASFLLNVDDVGTARIGQVTTSSCCAIIFYVAWKYFFQPSPAKSSIPQHQTLWTVGFYKVFHTFSRIKRELPALKWLMFAVMFGEAATNTLITISTTYMKTFLEMPANSIGLVMLAVLVMGGPGSKWGGFLSYAIGPVYSAALCNAFLILITTVAALTLTGPQHSHYMPLIGGLWGLGLGWLLPMHSTAFMTIIPPRGQEAEHMGLYILSGQILSWLPPMVFTAMNEAGMDMAYGLASLDIFFALAILCLLMVNNSIRNNDQKELLDTSDREVTIGFGAVDDPQQFTEMKEIIGAEDLSQTLPRRRSSGRLNIPTLT